MKAAASSPQMAELLNEFNDGQQRSNADAVLEVPTSNCVQRSVVPKAKDSTTTLVVPTVKIDVIFDIRHPSGYWIHEQPVL